MATSAMARETFVALRQQIARIEGRLAERLEVDSDHSDGIDRAALPPEIVMRLRQPVAPIGIESFDAALGGGLPLAGLVELHSDAVRDGATTAGFALALTRLALRPEAPLLWASTTEMMGESGRPYAPGLITRFGIPPHELVTAEAAKPRDLLWVAEEAANTGAFRALIVEMRGTPSVLDLTATRRLHRRAVFAGQPLFLMLHASNAQPTAAPLRLLVRPAPTTPRQTLSGVLAGSIGPPAFAVTVTKSRAPQSSQSFTLEWTENAFHEQTTHPRPVVSAPARRASDAPSLRQVLAFPTASEPSAVYLQPARKQHPTRRGA